MLSVVIITFNEERNIGRCLKSVKSIADDIVVVDSYSGDQTEEICMAEGARFIRRAWEGYAPAKNFGAQQARHDWILSIDADEALSDELAASIRELKKTAGSPPCEFNRLTNYCGKWIRHCGWYPDRKLRIYDRRKGAWQGEVHETIVLHEHEHIRRLAGDLLHYSYYTVAEHDRQIEKFSRLAAEMLYKKGERSGWAKIWIKSVSKFLKVLVVRLGFLDGYYGWVISVKSARESWLRYSGLRNLWLQKPAVS